MEAITDQLNLDIEFHTDIVKAWSDFKQTVFYEFDYITKRSVPAWELEQHKGNNYTAEIEQTRSMRRVLLVPLKTND